MPARRTWLLPATSIGRPAVSDSMRDGQVVIRRENIVLHRFDEPQALKLVKLLGFSFAMSLAGS